MHAVPFSKMKSTTQVLYCNLRPQHSVKPLNKFLATHISWIRCDNCLLQRRLIRFSVFISCFFFRQERINLLKQALAHKNTPKHKYFRFFLEPWTPRYRDFTITLRHATLSGTSLDEWSAERRHLYLTTYNTHNRQTFVLPAGFETAFPASERPQTHALDRVTTRIGRFLLYRMLWHVVTRVSFQTPFSNVT